jgi:hypothetical protein
MLILRLPNPANYIRYCLDDLHITRPPLTPANKVCLYWFTHCVGGTVYTPEDNAKDCRYWFLMILIDFNIPADHHSCQQDFFHSTTHRTVETQSCITFNLFVNIHIALPALLPTTQRIDLLIYARNKLCSLLPTIQRIDLLIYARNKLCSLLLTIQKRF